jgi:hypothetical protein
MVWVLSFTSWPLYPWTKSPCNPLYMGLDGPQNRYGRCGVEKNVLLPAGNQTLILQPASQRSNEGYRSWLGQYVCCYSVLSCVSRCLAVITKNSTQFFKIRRFRTNSESEEATAPNTCKIKALRFNLLSQFWRKKSKLMTSPFGLCVYPSYRWQAMAR